MQVKKALQGHPGSPRLWATLINRIILQLGFTLYRHEPYFYIHINYNGESIYFLIQVDDFVVRAPSRYTAERIITAINSQMTTRTKTLGVINKCNGIDMA